MSTKLTTSPRGGYALVDSRSLKLVRQMAEFQDQITNWLIAQLRIDGFATLSARQLTFLGQLDCGVNHAAELARHLRVSRQAVHKSVAELAREGWLETTAHPDFGNQKIIRFTDEGERMMACARQHFATLDGLLENRLGSAGWQVLDGLFAVFSDTP